MFVSSLYSFLFQGTADKFLGEGQLLPDNLVSACAESGVPIVMRMQEDYDHSYFFIATFMSDHFEHHAKYLKQWNKSFVRIIFWAFTGMRAFSVMVLFSIWLFVNLIFYAQKLQWRTLWKELDDISVMTNFNFSQLQKNCFKHPKIFIKL